MLPKRSLHSISIIRMALFTPGSGLRPSLVRRGSPIGTGLGAILPAVPLRMGASQAFPPSAVFFGRRLVASRHSPGQQVLVGFKRARRCQTNHYLLSMAVPGSFIERIGASHAAVIWMQELMMNLALQTPPHHHTRQMPT